MASPTLRYTSRLSPDVIARARDLKARLEHTKATLQLGFEWYPYDSMANVVHIDRLLNAAHLTLDQVIGSDPTADIGCGDGDFAFLLESLGYRVHCIDHPSSNHSGMRGVQALREALQSSVEIHPIDIDGRFVLPADRYGAAFFMGVLYHLKNPFYALETLSKQAKYCFLSTRVAASLPGLRESVRDQPVAYLLNADELNADDSNFWLFTEGGLRRLLQRTRWEVVSWISAEVKSGSDAADWRIFCLIRSHFALAHLDLLEGWYPAEEGSFRWTRRTFSLACPSNAAAFKMDVYLPDARRVNLKIAADGVALETLHCGEPGSHTCRRRLPRGVRRLDFQVDPPLAPSAGDHRELGIIVTSFEFDSQ